MRRPLPTKMADRLGFWGVSVKAGETARVEVAADRVLHLSSVCLRRPLKAAGGGGGHAGGPPHAHAPRHATVCVQGLSVCHLEQGRTSHAPLNLFFVGADGAVRIASKGTATVDVTGFLSVLDADTKAAATAPAGGRARNGDGAERRRSAPAKEEESDDDNDDDDEETTNTGGAGEHDDDEEDRTPAARKKREAISTWTQGAVSVAPSEAAMFRSFTPAAAAASPAGKKRKGGALSSPAGPNPKRAAADGAGARPEPASLKCPSPACPKRFASRQAMLQHAKAKHGL